MKRSNLIIFLVFLVLGIAVLIVEKPFTEPTKVLPPELGVMYPDFNKDEVARMEFGSFGGSTVLEKDGDSWVVIDNDKKYPADMEAIDKIFETIESMDAKEIVSKNPAKHMTFQVNSPQETQATGEDGKPESIRMGTLGTEVTMFNAQNVELAHFFVGKNSAADFMTTYVRKSDSDSVVVVDGYLKAVFGKGTAANWKDRMVCKIDADKISQVILGEGKTQIILEATEITSEDDATQKSVIWNMTSPKKMKVQQKDIDRITRSFSRFLATDYAPDVSDESVYGFEKPSAIVSVLLKDGETVKLVFGAVCEERNDQYFLKKDGDDRVFIVPKYRVETFQRKVEDFEPKEAEQLKK